jgi:hypothetical protein
MVNVWRFQKYQDSRVGSGVMNSVILWCGLVVCAGTLFFAGCDQANDPISTDSPIQLADPDQSEDPAKTADPVQGAELDQPDVPAVPEAPTQPDVPAQGEESDLPDVPVMPEVPTQPDTPVQSEEPVIIELTGAAALNAYLGTLPENTADTPYRIKVKGINLAKRDTLKTLYDALIRYVSLDLSDCTGESLPNITTSTAPGKTYLVSLILPDTVITIEVNAFSGCTVLTSVNMPQVTTIIHGAFSNLAKLTSVYMPQVQHLENDTKSSEGVFYKCVTLESVSMPKIQSIGRDSFYGCSSLKSITLGAVPPALEGTNVFKGTQALSAIYVPAAAVSIYQHTDNTNWSSELKQKVTPLP